MEIAPHNYPISLSDYCELGANMKFPVLAGQVDLLLEQQQGSTGGSNHLGFTMSFPNGVRPEHIAAGIQTVLRGFSALRSVFSGSVASGYVQEVEPFEDHVAAVEFSDVSDADPARQANYVRGLLHRDAAQWDWSRHGVYRFVVVKTSPTRFHLVISLQQIAVDHASIGLVLDALRAAVLAAAAGEDPVPPGDRYESAITDAQPSPAAAGAARRHWEREFELAGATFEECIDVPVARLRTHSAIIAGAAYLELTRNAAAGPWGPSALFFQRLAATWCEYQPRFTLIDVVFTMRSERLAQQVGMFSTVRPIIIDRDRPRWQAGIVGKLIRASAHQWVDSIALRDLESQRAICERPFPIFNYLDVSEAAGRLERADGVSIVKFVAPMSSQRPISLKIRNTGESFTIDLHANSAVFPPAASERILQGLVGR
ncbi:hypothetical protein [Nocardia sp. NPDC052566]|uniref:hypothetical protein n=1 Tax=Nocardia sp. NPDC052566 TaxID=3364330 RepID=UPI0037CA7885